MCSHPHTDLRAYTGTVGARLPRVGSEVSQKHAVQYMERKTRKRKSKWWTMLGSCQIQSTSIHPSFHGWKKQNSIAFPSWERSKNTTWLKKLEVNELQTSLCTLDLGLYGKKNRETSCRLPFTCLRQVLHSVSFLQHHWPSPSKTFFTDVVSSRQCCHVAGQTHKGTAPK